MMKYILYLENFQTTKISFDNDEIGYFIENGIRISNIEYLNKGEFSKTYKVSTENRGNFALHIRDEMVADYSDLIDEDFEYLPKIYDVRKLNDRYYITMELLNPITKEEKDIIDSIDFLFYENNYDGLDIWLEDNLHNDLYNKVRSLLGSTNFEDVSVANYKDKLKWFDRVCSDYENFINDIQESFVEYNRETRFKYGDFHGDNLMYDQYGQLKLIDL